MGDPIDFPATPTVNQLHPDPIQAGIPQYKWDGTTWLAVVPTGLTDYVKRSGDKMSGGLIVDAATLPGGVYPTTVTTSFAGLRATLGLNAYVGADGQWKAWATGYVNTISHNLAGGDIRFQTTVATVTAGSSAPLSTVATINKDGGVLCTSVACSGTASFTNNATVSGGSPSIYFVKNDGGYTELASYTGTAIAANQRWRVRMSDAVAESSTATGSDFKIYRYNNSGGSIGVPLQITRSTGVTRLESLEVNGSGSHDGYINIYGSSTNFHSLSDPVLGLGVYNVNVSTIRHIFSFSGTARYIFDNAYFYPVTSVTLGTGTYRWGQIYSTSATISTSDENLKQDIRPLTAAELNVARAMKGMMRAYRLKSEVADNPDAKTRIGVIAQQVVEVMTANGMDWHDYAFISCDEQYTEAWNEETQKYDRTYTGEFIYSVAYDELQCWILAAMLEELALLRAEK